jgi:sugar/nucleoside kinase (ribokinase family)
VARLELLTIGEAFHDLIFAGLPRLPRAGEELRVPSFAATFGGGAVITSVAAARLGVRTGVVSAMSAEAAAMLRRERIAVVNVARPREQPAVTVALSTPQDRSFVTFDGVNVRLQPRLERPAIARDAAHVHFAFRPVAWRRWAAIAERLRARGSTSSWDFGWHPALRTQRGVAALLQSVDYVFVNEAEALAFAGSERRARDRAFWRGVTRNVIIKLGRSGSRWIAEAFDVRAAAPHVRAIDTTGAGDAFNGGFLVAVLRGDEPRACLQTGNHVGAQSTRALGGIASLPRRVPRPA